MLAWNDLSTERPIGMAEGYIPYSKIKHYGEAECGLAGDGLDFFMSVIRRIDSGYLSDSAGGVRGEPGLREEVHVSDTAGIKGLLQRLAAPKGSGPRFTAQRPRQRMEPQ